MLVGIHQPHYLPWLRYFEKIARSDVFVVLDTVQFSKNGWQNRNKIKTPQGAALLTAPVHGNLDEPLHAIRIDNTAPWRRKHARAIEQNYRKAAYFDDYWPAIREFYERDWELLCELNGAMLDYFMKALGITTPVRYASQLHVTGEATERLVNLIKAVGGDAYYSGAYALDVYLDEAQLKDAGIDLVLQEWRAPVYPQLYGEFIPDLSIIDLLFNCGPQSLDALLNPSP